MSNSNITIFDSNFAYCGTDDIAYGGAIDMVDSFVTINNTVFDWNIAHSGAAIAFRCTTNNSWAIQLHDNNFTNNAASIQGGAIYYNFVRPNMDNNTFYDNEAEYGQNIASYAVRIVEVDKINQDIVLEGVASGITLTESPLSDGQDLLNLALVDYDDQLMILIDSSTIKITAIEDGTSLIGITEVKASNGVSKFEDIGFVFRPGSTNVNYQVSSSEIDQRKLQDIEYLINNNISVSFRFWKPGEFMTDDFRCIVCSAGTYSLTWNSTKCNQCLENTDWFGGTEINVDEKYWRNTLNSTEIMEWPNPDAWKGGYNTNETHPVSCNKGYQGYLCINWLSNDEVKYERIGDYQCVEWPNPIWNYFRFLLLLTIALIFISLLIGTSIRK